MVKAEITIEINKDNNLQLDLDLLKREDWKKDEYELAGIIQKILIDTINKIKRSGKVDEVKTETINE